jgi:predicted transcriptional regulator
MQHVMKEPKTINQLVDLLKRKRSAIARDVNILEELGLLVSTKCANPGHGIEKTVKSVASKIELRATLV